MFRSQTPLELPLEMKFQDIEKKTINIVKTASSYRKLLAAGEIVVFTVVDEYLINSAVYAANEQCHRGHHSRMQI